MLIKDEKNGISYKGVMSQFSGKSPENDKKEQKPLSRASKRVKQGVVRLKGDTGS